MGCVVDKIAEYAYNDEVEYARRMRDKAVMSDVHAKISIRYGDNGGIITEWVECYGKKFYRIANDGSIVDPLDMDEHHITSPITLEDWGKTTTLESPTSFFTKRQLMEEIRNFDAYARLFSGKDGEVNLQNIHFEGLMPIGDKYEVRWGYLTKI